MYYRSLLALLFPTIDPIIGGALIGGLGSVIGGAMGSSAQDRANETNILIADRNREFQNFMSNSAHQREVMDLRSAGLNPMLSAMGGSGASTPAGSSANVVASDQAAEGISRAASSAGEIARMKKDFEAQDANIALAKSQSEAAAAAKELSLSSAKKVETERKEIANRNFVFDANQPAVVREAENRKRQADEDAKYLNFDNTSRRVREGLGIANDAIGVVKPKINLGGTSREPRDSSGRTRAEVERDNYRKRYYPERYRD